MTRYFGPLTTVVLIFLWACACCALSCQNISVPVSIYSLNKQFPADVSESSITTAYLQTVPGLPDIAVKGNYVISATFCEPSEQVASRRGTLQILQHGAGYDRTFWSSLGTGQKLYSWVNYAAGLGYPTLAIDRLCNGASSHPNGILVCQQPAEADVLGQIVAAARGGHLDLGPASRSFNKVVLTCSSVGSDICAIYAGSRGSRAEALVLTSWSNKVFNGGFLTTLFGGVQPAFSAYPDRYAYLRSDPSYLTFAYEPGQRYLNYYGSFDPALARYDYLHQGTFTLGEALTIPLGQVSQPGYTGLVFSLNGNEDPTYCQSSPQTALQRSPGNCSAGFAETTRSAFPNARRYGSYVTLNTGHSVPLHRTAQASFQAAHDFLAANGL